MADLFTSGRLVDFILVVVVLEAAVLLLYWYRGRRGIAPLDLLPNLCAGAFLLLRIDASLPRSTAADLPTFTTLISSTHVIHPPF